jgi:hypothetical protein
MRHPPVLPASFVPLPFPLPANFYLSQRASRRLQLLLPQARAQAGFAFAVCAILHSGCAAAAAASPSMYEMPPYGQNKQRMVASEGSV